MRCQAALSVGRDLARDLLPDVGLPTGRFCRRSAGVLPPEGVASFRITLRPRAVCRQRRAFDPPAEHARTPHTRTAQSQVLHRCLSAGRPGPTRATATTGPQPDNTTVAVLASPGSSSPGSASPGSASPGSASPGSAPRLSRRSRQRDTPDWALWRDQHQPTGRVRGCGYWLATAGPMMSHHLGASAPRPCC